MRIVIAAVKVAQWHTAAEAVGAEGVEKSNHKQIRSIYEKFNSL